jgi:hypothetical protein
MISIQILFMQSFWNATWDNYFCYSSPFGPNNIRHGWHLKQILVDGGWQTHFRVIFNPQFYMLGLLDLILAFFTLT